MKGAYGLLLVAVAAQVQSASDESHLSLIPRHGDHNEGENHSSIEHDDADGMGMEMGPSPASMSHHHGRPILSDPNLEPQQRAYWEAYVPINFFTSEDGNKFLLWSHALLIFTSYCLMAPISLLMSNDLRAQWFYVPFQTVQTICSLVGIFCLALYSATAPPLYPGNVYSKLSIAVVILELTRWFVVLLRSATKYLSEDYCYHPANQRSFEDGPDDYALNNLHQNSQRGPSISSDSVRSGSSGCDASSFDTERSDTIPKPADYENNYPEPEKIVPSTLMMRLARNKTFAKINAIVGGFAGVLYHSLNIPLFFVECAYVLMGLATGFTIGQGHSIFALIAHFIKGFVFFFLGFMELARYLGAFSNRGWSWNTVTLRESGDDSSRLYIFQYLWPKYPTMEFVQSFLIFFYGATNIFLEHLGNNDGGKWSHKDLQHASIAFMFLGGGLCGLVIESVSVKSLISSAFGLQTSESTNSVRRGWSHNPMPAFIIFWTGALMSHHQQETELSTQIHVQWGMMLSLAAVFRLLTLILLTTKPRSASTFDEESPQRPFSELIVSFCLVCGGMIFMASNRETVEAMMYRGIDQMFTLNMSVGITVLMMAYFICATAVRGWANSRY